MQLIAYWRNSDMCLIRTDRQTGGYGIETRLQRTQSIDKTLRIKALEWISANDINYMIIMKECCALGIIHCGKNISRAGQFSPVIKETQRCCGDFERFAKCIKESGCLTLYSEWCVWIHVERSQ